MEKVNNELIVGKVQRLAAAVSHDASELSILMENLLQTVHEPGDCTPNDEVEKLQNKIRRLESDLAKLKKHRPAANTVDVPLTPNFDALTGLPVRHLCDEQLLNEIKRFKRYQRPLVVAKCLIGDYVMVRDKFGSKACAKAVMLIAKVLRKKLRSVDFLGRYNGDSFLLVLPETSGPQALTVLKKIQRIVSTIPFNFNQSPLRVQLTFGVTECVIDDSLDSILARTDRALKAASSGHRSNCELLLKQVVKPSEAKNAKNNYKMSCNLSFQ